MEKRIITISREFGSGGRFIGEEVAKKLGIAYYDKNIISQIAEKSGLSPEYIQHIIPVFQDKIGISSDDHARFLLCQLQYHLSLYLIYHILY